MALTLLCFMALAASPDVWTASPLTVVTESSLPPGTMEQTFRIYAARGEYESFQVGVRNTSKEAVSVRLEGGRIESLRVNPAVFRVGHALLPGGRGESAMTLQPDPLLPTRAGEIAPSATCAFWVRYRIPREAEPGIYTTSLDLRYGRRSQTIGVTIEVFDFVLPETPALPVYIPLEHERLATTLALTSPTAEALRPTYRTLATYPFAYGGWGGAQIGADHAVEGPERLLATMLRYSPMPLVDVGPGPLVGPAYLLRRNVNDDLELEKMGALRAWVLQNSERGRIVYGAAIHPPANKLSDFSGRLRAIRKTSTLERLVAGPLTPQLENEVELWGIPDSAYNPAARALLADGRSLAYLQQAKPAAIEGTDSGKAGAGPAQAYDGSLFTHWEPKDQSARTHNESLTIHFEEPASVQTVRIAWPFNLAPPDPQISLSTRAGYFAPASAEWKRFEAADAYAFGWYEATLDVPKLAFALRLTFEVRRSTSPYAIADITLGATPEYPPLAPGLAPELWLASAAGEYPPLNPGDSRIALRTVGWVAWSRQLGGLMLDGCANWPSRWTTATAFDGAPWPPLADYGDVLFYPWHNSVIPSIRAEILRDAVEDVAYATAFEDAVGIQPGDRRAIATAMRPMDPGPQPAPDALYTVWEHLYQARLAFGRAADSSVGLE